MYLSLEYFGLFENFAGGSILGPGSSKLSGVHVLHARSLIDQIEAPTSTDQPALRRMTHKGRLVYGSVSEAHGFRPPPSASPTMEVMQFERS